MALGSDRYEEVVLSESSLVGYWRLGETSGDFLDYLGVNDLALTGTWSRNVAGGPSTTTGAASSAANGYSRKSTPTGLPSGATSRTVELWYKGTSTAKQTVFSYGNNATRQAFSVAINEGGANRLGAWTWSDDGSVSVPEINDGNWHHIVVTYDGSTTITFYVDGTSRGTKTLGGSLNTQVPGDGFNVSGEMHSVTANRLNGTLDEVAVYNAVLSLDRIQLHYDVAWNQAKVIFPAAVILGTSSWSLPGHSIIQSSSQASVTADADLIAGFFASAIVLSSGVGGFTANAVLHQPIEFSGRYVAIPGHVWTESGRMVPGTVPDTYSASLSAGAWIAATVVANLVGDAVISAGTPNSGMFTADAIVFFERTELSFSADAVIWLVVWSDDFNRADEIPLSDPYVSVSADPFSLESNELRMSLDGFGDDTFGRIRGFPLFVDIGCVQFDFFTGTSDQDDGMFVEIDNIAGVRDGEWYYPWLALLPEAFQAGSNQLFFYVASDSFFSEEYILPTNSWYRIKLQYGETQERLKIWPVGDPEPDWQRIADRSTISGEPSATNYVWMAGSFFAEAARFDNLVLTSPTPGLQKVQASFSANAVIKATLTYADPGLLPVVVGSSLRTAFTGSSSSFLTPTGTQLGDTVIAVGLINAVATEAQTGTVRGILGGPTLTRVAYLPSVAGTTNTTLAAWAGVVAPQIGGFVPDSWPWENIVFGPLKIGVFVVARGGRVVGTAVYGTGPSSDRQTIPAGTIDILSINTLLLSVFGANELGVTGITPPINATEIAEVFSLQSGTGRAVAVNKTDQPAIGESPVLQADAQGGNAATRTMLLRVVPPSGIFANAYIKGPVVFVNAIITRPASVIWEDTFDDRVANAGWGGVWQSPVTTALTADGAVGLVGDTDGVERVLTGFPQPWDGVIYFEVLFRSPGTGQSVVVESLSDTFQVYSIALHTSGSIGLNVNTTAFSFEPNQYYSVRAQLGYAVSTLTVWRRGESEPVPQLSSASVYAPDYIPSWRVVSSDRVVIDNIEVSTGLGWTRRYFFRADAILKKTMVESVFWTGFSFVLRQHAIFCNAEILRGGRLTLNAYIRSAFSSASVSVDAQLVTHHTFHADAVISADVRTQHERSGSDHTGVDHDLHHTLAATISGHLAGENLRDVLVDLDQRISDLEAQ